jgi:hypothetical protein
MKTKYFLILSFIFYNANVLCKTRLNNNKPNHQSYNNRYHKADTPTYAEYAQTINNTLKYDTNKQYNGLPNKIYQNINGTKIQTKPIENNKCPECNKSEHICIDASASQMRIILKDNGAKLACKAYSDAIYCEMQKIQSEVTAIEKNIVPTINSNDKYKPKVEQKLNIIDEILVGCFHKHTVGEIDQDFKWYNYCRVHFEELQKRVTKLQYKLKEYSNAKNVNTDIKKKYTDIIDRLLKITDCLSKIRSIYHEEDREYRNQIQHKVKNQ